MTFISLRTDHIFLFRNENNTFVTCSIYVINNNPVVKNANKKCGAYKYKTFLMSKDPARPGKSNDTKIMLRLESEDLGTSRSAFRDSLHKIGNGIYKWNKLTKIEVNQFIDFK